MNDERRRLRIPGSFGSRLMLAQAIVIAGGGISVAIVALFVAPHTFHDHLGQARLEPGSVQADHVEAAFTSSIVVSMSVALITSTILATAVSWFLAIRRGYRRRQLPHARTRSPARHRVHPAQPSYQPTCTTAGFTRRHP